MELLFNYPEAAVFLVKAVDDDGAEDEGKRMGIQTEHTKL